MIEIINIMLSGVVISATVVPKEDNPSFEIAINIETMEIVKNTSDGFGMYERGALYKLLTLYREFGVNLPEKAFCAYY